MLYAEGFTPLTEHNTYSISIKNSGTPQPAPRNSFRRGGRNP